MRFVTKIYTIVGFAASSRTFEMYDHFKKCILIFLSKIGLKEINSSFECANQIVLPEFDRENWISHNVVFKFLNVISMVKKLVL